MDAEGRITALNPAAERLVATTQERALGLEATLPDGRRARLRASAGPLTDPSGVLTGIVFVAEDRSEAVAATEGQDRLRDALRRYAGDHIAAGVDSHPSMIGVGGVRQVVSVLHSDVRGYTTVSEALEPEAVHALLMRFHGAAVAALQIEGATIDRYIGDAILALWNAPTRRPDHARMALRGALAMRDATIKAGDEMRYGIGVHTGDAVVGNLGSEQYMHYTAIGDTVNIASRLQGSAAGGEVVCSGATYRAAGPGIQATPLGELAVKGRKGTVEAYRVEGIVG